MTEAQALSWLIVAHVEKIVTRARAMSEDQWNWSSEPHVPSTAALAEHAWSWLVSDRMHIQDPNEEIGFCPEGPTPPKDNLIDLLEAEAATWQNMLEPMDSATLDEPRRNFGQQFVTVRFLVLHMAQNVIYKSGQVSMNYFAQGLDGTEPYTAPFPRDMVELVRQERELIKTAGAPG